MQNNVQKKYPWAALMLSNYHTKLANDAKYDGVEWYSFRSSSFQLRYFPSTIDLKRIKSTHQSWGSGKFPQNIGMVGKLESLKDLVRIQSFKNNDFITVIYPHEELKGETWPSEFDKLTHKIFQPTPEQMWEWHANNLKEYLKIGREFGFKACIDLFHIRRPAIRGDKSLGHWKNVIETFKDDIDEIHIGVGREDFKGPFDSMEELADLYFGTRKTEIFPMLEYLKNGDWAGPVVTEIPAESTIKLLSPTQKVVTPTLLTKVHTQIVKNIEEAMKR